jgi:hypothetical protein
MGVDLTQRGSPVVRRGPHKPEIAGSIPAPAIEPSAATVRASVERGDPFAARAFPAMLGGSLTSEPEGWSTAAGLPARAHEAVADDAHRADTQVGVVAADTDRDDPASVEHVRQSRLSRWQRLPAA